MSIQNPTATDLSAFVSDQDQKNSQLAGMARSISWLPQVDPTWVRDWNAYMTRYVQAREVANKKVAASAGLSLDDVPAQAEFDALNRAVKPYESAQASGDFADLSDRVRRAGSRGAPAAGSGRMSWSQIRNRLNAAGAVPALDVVEQGGPDVQRALAAFQAMNNLPSTGKLSPQTIAFLAAHGEGEKNVGTWRARFGGNSSAIGVDATANIMKALQSPTATDVAKFVGAGAVLGLIAKSLGAGLLGTAAAATGGVALAAWAIANPRRATA